MKDLVKSAEYIIQLATNSVTEEVRNSYYNDIEDEVEFTRALELLIKSVLKGYDDKNFSIEEGIVLFEKEYETSSLSNFFGSKEGYVNLVRLAMEARSYGPGEGKVETYKSFIEIADALYENIRYSIYKACLLRLVYGNMILEDLEFSKKVMNYVNDNSIIEDSKLLYDLIIEIMNYM